MYSNNAIRSSSVSGRSSEPSSHETEDFYSKMADVVLKCGDCGMCCYTLAAFNQHECRGPATSQENVLSTSASSSSSTCSNKSDSTSVWTKPKSKLLLQLYSERTDLFNSATVKKKNVWGQMTTIINETFKSNFSTQQVEGRWKTILAGFRKYKDNMNKTGAGRKEFEFVEEMEEIMGESHATRPSFVFSSSSSSSSQEPGPSNSTSSTNTQSCPHPTSRDTTPSPCPSDDEEGTSISKRKKKSESGSNKRKRATSGASQILQFLESYTERLDKRDEEMQLRSDEKHREQMNVLQNLSSVLKNLAETSTQK